MDVTLRVFVYGLMLFVPDSDQVKTLTVVFPDALAPHVASDGCPIHRHEAKLLYQPNVAGCSPWCEPAGGLCACGLDDVDIFLPSTGRKQEWKKADRRCFETAIPPLPVRRFGFVYGILGKRGAKKGCAPDAEKGAQLKMTLEQNRRNAPNVDPRNTCPTAPPMEYAVSTPAEVHARAMLFEPEPLEICRWTHGGKELAFRSMTRNSGLTPFSPMTLKTATSDITLLPVQQSSCKADGNEVVRVWIASFGRTRAFYVDIPVFKQNGVDYADLVLSHAPTPAHATAGNGRCGDHAIGRDFELLPDLLKDPLDFEKRVVPQLTGMGGDKYMRKCADNKDEELCASNLLDTLEADLLRSGLQVEICTKGQARGGGP